MMNLQHTLEARAAVIAKLEAADKAANAAMDAADAAAGPEGMSDDEFQRLSDELVKARRNLIKAKTGNGWQAFQ